MGIAVLTPCPISGLGEKMVTAPLSAIFMKALKSLKFNWEIFTGGFTLGLQAVKRLKPIRRPPLAREDVLINARLLNAIGDVDIFLVFIPQYSEGFIFGSCEWVGLNFSKGNGLSHFFSGNCYSTMNSGIGSTSADI